MDATAHGARRNAVRIIRGGFAMLAGEKVEVLGFGSVPTFLNPGTRPVAVDYVAGATIRWLAETTISFTKGATYTVEYDSLTACSAEPNTSSSVR
jgi:hypothetical protein